MAQSSSARRLLGAVLLAALALGMPGFGCGTGGIKGQGYSVEDEPQGDTTPDGARTLSPGVTQQGFIEYEGDADWYRLEIPAQADTLRFELSNQTLQSDVDLSLTVYRADGQTILGGRYDANGGDGLTQITLELTVEDLASCFVVVRDHLGDDADPLHPYFLRVTVTAGPGDGNNSPETATPLPCGEPVEEAIQAEADVDWFRVELPAGSDILALSATMAAGAPDLMLTLYESTATTALVSLSDPDGGDGPTSLHRNVHLAQAGTYYVAIRDTLDDEADADLPYTLEAVCAADPDPNEPNGNFDTDQENMAHATSLPLDGTTVSGWIAFEGDEDWFRVEMPQDGLLNLSIRTTAGNMPVELLCTLLGSDGHAAEGEFVVTTGQDPADFSLRAALPAGVHYLRIRDEGDDGADLADSYTLEAAFEPDPDPNEPNGNFDTDQENRNHATILLPGVPGEGYIGSNSDQDWFQVFVQDPGIYHFALSNGQASPVDLSLNLYRVDANGMNLILSRHEEDGQGEDGPTEIEAQLYLFETGTYYVVVQDLENDETDLDVPYQVQVDPVDLPAGSLEPDEDRSQYHLLTSGQEVQGYIEFEGDRDWYAIPITTTQDVLVEIWNESPSPVEFIWFMYEPDSTRVYASAGDSTESDDNLIHIITGDDEEFWVDEQDAGLYLFKISDFNRNDWDTVVPYHFRVVLTPHGS